MKETSSKNTTILLLQNMLKSSGIINQIKNGKDKKKRNNLIGNMVAYGFLYLLIAVYTLIVVVECGLFGFTNSIPTMCALTITAVTFIFTLFMHNAYMFTFKPYDLIMSLPISTKEVTLSRFLFMYVKNLPWALIIALSMGGGYFYFEKPDALSCLLWIVLAFILPIPAMVLAGIIDSLIAGLGVRFKNKQLAQAFLSIIFVLLAFSLRFIMEAIFRNNASVEGVITALSEKGNVIQSYIPSVKAFEGAIRSDNIWLKLLIGVGLTAASIALLEMFVIVLSGKFKKLNSKLMAGLSESSKTGITGREKSKIKSRSAHQAIAFKELKRMLNSNAYLINMGLGQILCMIVTVALLFVDMDKIIAIVTQGAPVTKQMMIPALPFAIYFMLGMVTTTAVSMSLEGKSFWIIKSSPIKMEDVVKGKMLLQIYISVPFMTIASIVGGISAGAGFINILLSIVVGFVLCMFSVYYGMVCGLRFIKLEWENEIEVIKQGAALVVYIFPNMILDIILVVLSVIAGLYGISTPLIFIIATALMMILNVICRLRVKTLTKKLL